MKPGKIGINICIRLLIVLAVAVPATGFRPAPSTLGLITKTILDVTKRGSESDWQKTARGEALAAGDAVRTGQKSLAVIKFLDNSIVRVRELSEISMSTEVTGALRLKTIQISRGAYGFDVRKQQNEQFRLTSPTSVASIRGTRGKYSGGGGNDTLVVAEGLVNLANKNSGKDLDVPAGYIAFSSDDGTLTSRRATEEELADALNAATGGSENELKLELKDKQGNKKDLKLRFRR